MTVSTTTIKNSYSGNGSATAFNYTFKIFASSELKVYIRTTATGAETLKTVTTHYTVSGIGDTGGGTVTFTSGNVPTSAEQVILVRDTPLTQSTDYVENDPFPASSHEDALDKLTHQMQEQQEELDRSFKVSKTVTDLTSSEVVDDAATRASKLLGFSSNGASFAYYDNASTDVEVAAIAGLTSAANKIIRYTGSGTADLIDFLDQDDMSSNSASAVPSQQSVKAYVDSGTATLTNKTLTAPKFADGGFIADANGNELIKLETTSSAVNELSVTNSATGNAITLSATGGDTNIDIDLTPKGSGEINIAAGNLNYAGTAVTATGAELNILDGVTSTATELNLLDGSSAGSIVNSKAVIYSSGGVVNATDVAVSGSGNRAISITSTDGIASMEIGAAASNAAFIDFKTPSSDDYDLRIASLAGGSGGSITLASGTFSILTSGETAATFADDGAVTLYHDNSAKLTTTSAGVTVTGTLTATTSIIPDAPDGAYLGDTTNGWSDLYLTDGAMINFGNDQDVRITHNVDRGLTLKNTNTGDDSYFVLGLQTGETDIQANDIIAAIDFSAPNEGTGTDANTVAAAIVAVSEGDFAADNNATSLSFRTGASGSATEKMKLSSGGVLTLDTALASTDLFIIKTSGNSGTGLYINSQTANQIDLVGYDGGAATAVNIRSGGASGSGILVDTSNDTKITGVLTLTGEGSNTTNATQGVAKSWAKATGSGTASLDDSLNISSLTDNGTGDYTFTLSTNMGNVNACLTANSGQATTRSETNCTTSTFDIDLYNPDSSARGDSGRVFGALHGDLS